MGPNEQELSSMEGTIDDRDWQVPEFRIDELASRGSDYCIVIPVINEGERIQKQLSKMMELEIWKQADVLIADGGSTDGSLDLGFLRKNHVRTLLTKTGPGKLSAQLRMGYAYALRQGYLGIVTIDGNDKDGVEGIFTILTDLRDGWDMVQGSRFVKGGEAVNTPLVRLLAIHFLHAPILSIASRFHYTDTTNGFRGYSRRFLLDPRVQPFRDCFTTYELLPYLNVRAARLGFRTKETPVARRYPKGEKPPTKISFLKGNWNLVRILFAAAFGCYNPRTEITS